MKIQYIVAIAGLCLGAYFISKRGAVKTEAPQDYEEEEVGIADSAPAPTARQPAAEKSESLPGPVAAAQPANDPSATEAKTATRDLRIPSAVRYRTFLEEELQLTPEQMAFVTQVEDATFRKIDELADEEEISQENIDQLTNERSQALEEALGAEKYRAYVEYLSPPPLPDHGPDAPPNSHDSI